MESGTNTRTFPARQGLGTMQSNNLKSIMVSPSPKWYLTKGITFQKEYIPVPQTERIMADADNPKYKDNPRELWTAYMEEWQYSGASSVPTAVTASHHTKFFSALPFETILTFLHRVKT